ncbi:MAG: N-6 DNA methylase, partial [Chitinophagaceae bacterium]
AGQFRTPRHIIDFIVEVLLPKKTETILDPACGTAGFLISSYKHILKNNRKKNSDISELTPDDRKKMMQNFVGYDISPDMVRLSLVNMYLHGFITPNIYEYDTLTSEDRWSEYFDVIIANPPFMTPKGGIKPHKKFTIQANRSEVLFVDYIAEHIHPGTGRAGIIVPEGIIFQSATAYKTLRKMLVDKNYLYAVVSLPAGIFNPYSGVKTSILLMDKTLAKKTDNILFVKIDNDGFDLGAQRRAIANNDLTGCLELLQQYKTALQDKTEFESDNKNVFLVEKKRIGEKDDYNLSVDRYRVNENIQHSNFAVVKLGEVAEVISGQSPESEFYNNKKEGMPFYQGRTEFGEIFIGEPKTWTTKITKTAIKDDILMSVRAPVGPVNIATQEICIGRGIAAIRPNEKILKTFLFTFLKSIQENIKGNGGAVFDSINRNQIMDLEIPLPPLSIQQQIVSKIESYQAIINGAKQVVENFKPQIEINADWEIVELGSVCEFSQGIQVDLELQSKDYVEGYDKFLRIENYTQNSNDLR